MIYQSGDNLHVFSFSLDKFCFETLGRLASELPSLVFIHFKFVEDYTNIFRDCEWTPVDLSLLVKIIYIVNGIL
jgi:hypothetical protein